MTKSKKTFYCPVCEKSYKPSLIKGEMIEDITTIPKEDKIKLWCPTNEKHFEILREKMYNDISLETKTAFMDLLKTGKCLGDCAKELNLTTDQAGEILHRQIKQFAYIDWEPKK